MEKKLKNLYENPSNPGSFTGFNKFSKSIAIKRFKPKDIKSFLSKNDAYSLHKKKTKKFRRRRVIVSGIDDTWEADLIDVSSIKKENNGYTFILTLIDVFSKKAWAVKLKNKASTSCLNAYKEILKKSKRICGKLHTDKGLEFYGKPFKDFLKSKNILLYSTKSEIKGSIIERFNRTLKEKMWRYFTSVSNKNWIKILDKLLLSYNNTYHSSIKLTPNQVNYRNESQVFLNLFGYKKESFSKEIAKINFKVGDNVRISKVKSTFEKGYLRNWTNEIFVIYKIIGSLPVTYIIKDFDNEIIKGSFYEKELQFVDKLEKIFKIEKILDKRKIKNKNFLLLKWEGYSSKFNSWVAESDIKLI